MNKSIKLISIEHVKYGAAINSSRKGQNSKFFLFVKISFTITRKRLIKLFVYQNVANLVLYKNKH